MGDKKLLFSKMLKDIRLKKGLSQEDLAQLSYINIRTISRIENGKCNYDFDKLEILSNIYGIDLIERYFYIFYDDCEKLDYIIDSIDKKDRINGTSMSKEIQELTEIMEKSNRKYIKTKAYKLILFLKSIEEENISTRRKLLLDALNLDGKFDLEILDNNYYDYIDYRILMNYAFTLNAPEDRLDIYKFIEKSYLPDNNLKELLYNNMAIDYYILDENEKALTYINKAIFETSKHSKSPVVLYTKALIMENLGLSYEEYIERSLFLARLQGEELYNTILNHRKNRTNK
ncbi:MAG: helix-turn-helix transcriptional regulator [Peptoniphilaceae bacterium]|nr:helix-turn-helix transcriptional regulator [Peptoniphilaceae bacterium]MDY6018948.1 helix-turn-helix transcriptional regulator [Anaerococcus sp.]